MISPEILRRFPFFAHFNEAQLVEIAMVADLVALPKGAVIFEECNPADAMYVLVTGEVELYYKVEEEHKPEFTKEFEVGHINPGEILSLSALIEPYVTNSGARTTAVSTLVEINAPAFRELMEKDWHIAYLTMHKLAKAIMERLAFTRVQLAAAWAK
jgi:CRP-like cAMP-binding protein